MPFPLHLAGVLFGLYIYALLLAVAYWQWVVGLFLAGMLVVAAHNWAVHLAYRLEHGRWGLYENEVREKLWLVW
jgi:hypothetical protein